MDFEKFASSATVGEMSEAHLTCILGNTRDDARWPSKAPRRGGKTQSHATYRYTHIHKYILTYKHIHAKTPRHTDMNGGDYI